MKYDKFLTMLTCFISADIKHIYVVENLSYIYLL